MDDGFLSFHLDMDASYSKAVYLFFRRERNKIRYGKGGWPFVTPGVRIRHKGFTKRLNVTLTSLALINS